MGRFFANISEFLSKHVAVYLVIITSIMVTMFFGANRIQVDENIYSIFPQGEAFKKFSKVLKENNLNKQVLFSFDVNEDVDTYEELNAISSLVIKKSEGYLNGFDIFHDDTEERVVDHFYNTFPAILTIKDYEKIDDRLQKDSVESSISVAAEKLTSINSLFLRKYIAKDPLGIAWDKLRLIQPRSDSTLSMTVEDGILYNSNKSKVYFTATLDFNVNDNVKNEHLNELLNTLRDEVNEDDEALNFDYFGTFQIAYENSKQVKQDTFVTLIVSVGLILLLLIVYFRSLLVPLYFVLPALFSGFCGLGIVGFVHPDISAISLATSAVLMGIVLDYSFHFFTHYNQSGDLVETVKEIAFPMLVGSFTTVAAFSALMFTDSVVLQNFGLIALCTLTSAALFTLLLLPAILKITKYRPKPKERQQGKEVSKVLMRISLLAIVALSIVFLLKANQFKFDSDLNNLSFHPKELAEKEEQYTGINPKEEKKLHLFVSGNTKEDALIANYKLYEFVQSLPEEVIVEEFISAAPYCLPINKINEGLNQWNKYWDSNEFPMMEYLNAAAVEKGFSQQAFQPFKKWIHRSEINQDDELLSDLGLDRLLYTNGTDWNVVSSVVVKRSRLDAFKQELSKLPEVVIFDVSEMASSLMVSVQDDFNYLLVFSSLIVFLSLLLIYGRIELALFAFLPMVISWVWILGIAAIFDIQFNFVNIIVATFIFGLGDDFSIFVTDGLIQKYKTQSMSWLSYRSAILLSGITTIIGTGALYFAKHPAIHSIAAISVVGISCILMVTLVLQPAIFRFFVTNRTANKRSPVTLMGLLISLCLFTYFFVGCIFLNVFLLILIPIPVSKKKKRKLLNFLVSKLAKSTIYAGFHIKKKIINGDRLNFDKPSIIVANHSSFLDILLMIMLNPRVIIMVKKWVYYSPVFGLFIRYSGYLFVAEGAEYNMELIRKRVDAGYSIMIFPEGTRSKDGEIKRFHKGAFYLAQELNLDVQPIVIVGAHYVNPKNDFIIKKGALILDVMDRITPQDEIYNQRFGLFAKSVLTKMRLQKIETEKSIQTVDYLASRVHYNYLYKGPILEWYVRVKWMFEKKNYQYYDELVGDRTKIYDIGCGLGYLSYYLHYRNPNRTIVGSDYDEEKIKIAQNGYDKSKQLTFSYGDLRSMEIENADVIFYNDVLHYISAEDQWKTLTSAVEKLNPNGLLIIRDGITDLENRHDVTAKTEKYSTSIIKFNKATTELSFFSSEDIFTFAKQHKLDCEMIEQSKKTSNVLFVLRK